MCINGEAVHYITMYYYTWILIFAIISFQLTTIPAESITYNMDSRNIQAGLLENQTWYRTI